MTAKNRWLAVCLAVASGLVFLLGQLQTRPGRDDDPRPNVILIVIDTLRADHLHGYGYRRETSPNLDRLMDQGVKFESAIANSSWSAPSHTSILTGVPAYRHTVLDFSDRIADGIEPLASVFKKSGYATGLFSTHVGLHSGVGRITEGMDEIVILQNQFDAKVLERAQRWSKRQDRPFFLYLVLMGPHAPYEKYPELDDDVYFTDAPPGAKKQYPFVDDWWTGAGGIPKSVQLQDRHDVGFYVNRYDRAIRYTDELLGRLLEGMRSSGLLENSVLAVTSDHGEGLGDHDYFSHEFHLYDFLIRIPLIFVSPGKIAAGSSIDAVVQHEDIAPTLLGLAGMQVPTFMEGRDLSANLQHDRPLDPDAIATSIYRLRGHDRYAARTAHHKLIYDAINRRAEFYDLDSDPGETRNLLLNRNENFPAEIYYRLRTKTLDLVERHKSLKPVRKLEELAPEVLQELKALGYVE